MNRLILITLMTAIFIFSGCGSDNSYGEIYIPKDKQKTESELSDNIQSTSEDQDYAKYGLRANSYQDPIGWTDGTKYGFGKITILEENQLKFIEQENNHEETVEYLKRSRSIWGGVPHGLLNDVILAGRNLDSDDLRLGWIDIDEEITSVINKMGEPAKIEEKNGEKIYLYQTGTISRNMPYMEIYVKNSRVSSIISTSPQITTPRNVSAANDKLTKSDRSTRKAVISAYGSDYNSTDYNDLELIEYIIHSKNGQQCILRFAINKSNSYIDYISIRHKNGDESDTSKGLGTNWIKDNASEIYMQNPSPSEGETISWSGGYVQDGEYKFANGSGTTVWKNSAGEVVQVDEGTFEHGQRQGQFKHQVFPSGNVIYSNWKNGKKVS